MAAQDSRERNQMSLTSEDLWQKFIGSEAIRNKYYILGSAVDLFNEALRGFNDQTQTYLASCICSRAAIEAALHKAKTTERLRDFNALDSGTRRKELLIWARKQEWYDSALEKRVEKALARGDLGAHLAQRIDRAFQEAGTEQPVQLWVSRDEAWESILTCRDLIERIATHRWE